MLKAAENKLINGWAMARRVGKDEKNVKYITWISFGRHSISKESL